MKNYKSKLNNKFQVYIIDKEDGDTYTSMQEIIPKGDIAFTELSRNIIMIDGEQAKKLNNNHIKFIEAHEICHHLLKHSSNHGEKEEEKEADLGAYVLLNNDKAAKLIPKYFKMRHGIEFKQYKADNLKIVQQKLK